MNSDFFLDERIMRGLIGGIEYGLHVFSTYPITPTVHMFCPYRFCGYSHDDVEILALAECRNGLDHLSGDAHIGAIGAPRGGAG